MKKTLLASALFAGISAYAAIPSDINERADLVQKRNEALRTSANTLYQKYFSASPIFNKIDIQVRDYKRGEQGATSQSVIVIDWNKAFFGGEDVPVKEIVFNNTYDYSDAVAKADKLAVIKSELDTASLAASLKLEKGSDDARLLNEIVSHVEMTTTLLDDDKLRQVTRIKPVDAKPGEGLHIAYEGLEYTLDSTDADIAGNYGKTAFKSGKLEISNSKPDNDGPKKVTVMPVAGEGEYRKNGDMIFDAKPFEIHLDDLVIKAKNMEGKGKDLVFDPVLAGYLGEMQIKVNDIAVSSPTSPEAVYLKTAIMTVEHEKSGDLYRGGMKFEAIPVPESFSALTGGMSDALGVQSLIGSFDFKNMSAGMLTTLNNLQPAIMQAQNGGEEGKAELAKQFDSILAEAGKHGSSFAFALAVNAKPGNATLDAQAEVIKGSKLTFAELETASKADDPKQFIELLNKNVRFEVNVVLPKALVDALGAGAFLEGNPYLPLDGKNYKLNLKNGDKGITLNGQPFPPGQ